MNLSEKLGRWLLEHHPQDAVPTLLGLSGSAVAELLAPLPRTTLGATLVALGPTHAARALESLPPPKVVEVIEDLPLAAAAALLRRVSPERQEAALSNVVPARRSLLSRLLQVNDGSAGALMDPQVLALPASLTAKEAKRQVERSSDLRLFYIYVVDDAHRLVGVLDLRELFLGEPRQQLGELMRTEVASIPAHADLRRVIRHPGWGVAHALPVVDEAGVMLGAITHQTLRRLEQEVDAVELEGAGGDITAAALGDLFWTGISGLVGAVGTKLELPAAPGQGRPR